VTKAADPRPLEGESAARRLVGALEQVRATVSYLRAEVGDPGEHARPGEAPADGSWVRSEELVRDPDWLAVVIGDSGRRLGTDDPVVAASLFVQNYSYRVLTLAIACLAISGVVPDSSASAMSMMLSGGRPSTVGYVAPAALVVCEPGVAVQAALEDDESIASAFGFVVAQGIDKHIAPLISSTRSRVRVGSRLLWGNVAASAAVAFRTLEGCLGPWVQPLGERFFRTGPGELGGLGSFLVLEDGGRRGWYWERTNCCLYDRLPGKTRCSDCSRTPEDERRAGYLASLRGE